MNAPGRAILRDAFCAGFRNMRTVDLDQRSRGSTPHRLQGAVQLGVAVPLTWYVSFEIRKRGLLKKERSPRETRTFATEAEAKMFAREKLEASLVVFAGTINPHAPKRLILSHEIADWLAERPEPTSSEDRQGPKG